MPLAWLNSCRCPVLLTGWFAPALVWLLPLHSAAAGTAGEQIYTSKCAVCHGSKGEGTKKHQQPLAGDRTAAQLVEFIGRKMPEDDPGSLSSQEAASVAAFVFGKIYSPVARERNRPARIELARLTVREYRQAVADLIGSFRGPAPWGTGQGLKAEYYRSQNFDSGQMAIERTDPQVNFDFGTDAPAPDKIDPHEFSIRWTGSVLAAETGEYEFVVRTDHSTRLWVNDRHHPLIDALVKSGNDTEYKASLFLIGGRVYSLRLEFAKGMTGVHDSKKKETKPPPAKASIALAWKRPLGAEEPIPARQLSPSMSPELFVCASFPPDDRSYGWERGTTVSKEWDQATTDAAIETAEYVVGRLGDLAGVKNDAADRSVKLRAFCLIFAERAFRRPLTTEETATLIEKQFAAAKDPETAVKRVVLRVLKSPRFLYHELGGAWDGYAVAARLSFGLWDSIPDQELLHAAAAGQLSKKEQVATQAERMLADPRAKAKLREFLLTWLKTDPPRDLAKDATKFPGFDAAVRADLRTSLELFLDEVVSSEKSDFRQLFSADYLFLNGRLAKFYGTSLPADADFIKVKLDAEERAGVLTHPFVMASFAHSRESSPILRGVFLARGVLAQSLRPPPEAFAPLSPELKPTLTTRERVALQTQASSCMNCHGIINPLGFTLEHFDAVGRYRDRDNGKPVDATGTYRTRAGRSVTLKNAHELAAFLVDSDEAQTAFAEQMFHHLVRQPVRAYGKTTMKELRRSFAASGFNIRKLAVEIMTESALTPRDAKPRETMDAHH